jgi:hypothetical protein
VDGEWVAGAGMGWCKQEHESGKGECWEKKNNAGIPVEKQESVVVLECRRGELGRDGEEEEESVKRSWTLFYKDFKFHSYKYTWH